MPRVGLRFHAGSAGRPRPRNPARDVTSIRKYALLAANRLDLAIVLLGVFCSLLLAMGARSAAPVLAAVLGLALLVAGAGVALLPLVRRAHAMDFSLYWHAAAAVAGFALLLHAQQGWAFYAYAGLVFFGWLEAVTLAQTRADAPGLRPALAWTRRNAVFLATFAALLLVFGAYWAAYYPAIMSPDSLSEWSQVMTMHLSDYSPAVYTLFVWISGGLWHSPASVAAAQLLASAAAIALAVAYLHRRGVSRAVLALGMALYMGLPIFGTFTVTLWHDIPYSLIVLWITYAMYEMHVSKGRWLDARWRRWALGASLVLLPLFAHNGLSVVFGVLMGAWVVLKTYRRAVIWIALGTVAGFLGVQYLVYPAIGVQPYSKAFASEAMIHQISAAITEHGVQGLPARDVAYLERIMPLKDWTKKFNPYTPQFLVSPRYNPSYNESPIDSHFSEFLHVWAAIGEKHPDSYLRERLTENALILYPTGSHRIALSPLRIAPNTAGLRTRSLAQALLDNLRNIENYTTAKLLWIWRPFWVMWLLLALTLAGWYLRGRRILFAAIPWVFQVLGLAIAIQGQSVRYYYSLFLILPYFIGLLGLRTTRRAAPAQAADLLQFPAAGDAAPLQRQAGG